MRIRWRIIRRFEQSASKPGNASGKKKKSLTIGRTRSLDAVKVLEPLAKFHIVLELAIDELFNIDRALNVALGKHVLQNLEILQFLILGARAEIDAMQRHLACGWRKYETSARTDR